MNTLDELKENFRTVDATSMDDILCLASLIAGGLMKPMSDVDMAREYWLTLDGGCNSCPMAKKCLIYLISE